VRRAAGLALRMARYRVAAMAWMFLLLAAATRGGLSDLGPRHLLAVLALAASYVAATTVNDVADRDVDAVNHPGDPGRPLVTGDATERDLVLLHVGAAAFALAAAVALGAVAAAVVAASLVVGWAYSLPPARLSYRTWLAPLALTGAYVTVPYALGLAVSRATPAPRDALLCGALCSLFLARIVLKDFRDRVGDARYGKPTLLLRFGKAPTCLVSLAALAVGNVLLLAYLRPPLLLGALAQLFVAGIAAMLWSLYRASEPRREQIAIGVGAKTGNGLLLTVLAWLVLTGHGAPVEQALALAGALTAAFSASFLVLVLRPDQATIGYKG
jgi:chlorophyll/bacteriochlorophyll a synthase